MKTAGKKKFTKLLTYIGIITFLFFFTFPIIWELSTSFKTNDESFAGYNLIPHHFTIEGYLKALTESSMGTYFSNTVFVVFCIALGSAIACSMAGFAFGQLKFPGKDFLFFLYITTLMIPVSVTIIPSYIIMIKLGWANSYYALIVPFLFGNAFGTFLLRQFYQTLPRELFESATIDGAGYFQTWLHIMAPLTAPAIATFALMTIQSQWNSLLWPLVVTQSPQFKTLALGLSDFRLMRVVNWNAMMAAVMIATAPMIILLFVANKFFLRSIQLSGINR
ncbi:MAG TPA: carbohydrate ABC transporter permease [Bacillota bacterium]